MLPWQRRMRDRKRQLKIKALASAIAIYVTLVFGIFFSSYQPVQRIHLRVHPGAKGNPSPVLFMQNPSAAQRNRSGVRKGTVTHKKSGKPAGKKAQKKVAPKPQPKPAKKTAPQKPQPQPKKKPIKPKPKPKPKPKKPVIKKEPPKKKPVIKKPQPKKKIEPKKEPKKPKEVKKKVEPPKKVTPQPPPKKKLEPKKEPKKKEEPKKPEKATEQPEVLPEAQKEQIKKEEPHSELQAPEVPAEQEVTELYVDEGYDQGSRAHIALSRAVARTWKPPHGLVDNLSSQLIVQITQEGTVANVKIEKKSGVLAYDLSARAALWRVEYPQEFWGKSISILFGPQ